MTTIAHPTFPDCVLVPAPSSALAWSLMRALDDAGFSCGFPSLTPIPGFDRDTRGVAVKGQINDADHVAKIEKIRISIVGRYLLTLEIIEGERKGEIVQRPYGAPMPIGSEVWASALGYPYKILNCEEVQA